MKTLNPTRSIKSLVVYASLLALCSCGHNADNHECVYISERDNIEDAVLVAIEDSLPDVHGYSDLYIVGDFLIIHDHKSQDKQFYAYDINSRKYIGSFGKFGNGPGEIANFGGIFFDAGKRILYGSNLNQWHIAGFQLDSALANPDYNAFVKTKINSVDGPTPVTDDPYFVNDSLVICSVYIPNDEWNKLENHLGHLNLNTGITTVFDSLPTGDTSHNSVAISPEHNLIVMAGKRNDRIRLLDMNGKLHKVIYGPERNNTDKNTTFFTEIIVCGDKIYGAYNGKNVRERLYGEDIVVSSIDGEYIKTIHVGLPVTGLAYHKSSNRLYISTDGEPQFSYIQLTD